MLDGHRDEEVPEPGPELPPSTKDSSADPGGGMCPKAPKQPAAQLWMGGAAHSPNSTPAPTTHRHTCSAQEHVKGSILTRLHDTDRLNPPSSRPVVIQTAPVQHKTESTALRVSKGAALRHSAHSLVCSRHRRPPPDPLSLPPELCTHGKQF